MQQARYSGERLRGNTRSGKRPTLWFDIETLRVRLRAARSLLDGRVQRRLAMYEAVRKMDCQGRETSGLGSELAIHGLNLIQIISLW